MKKLSDHYGIKTEKLKELDVFDAIIGTDNPYFFDPTLLQFTEAPEFANAREELLDYFSKVIALIESGNDAYFERAVYMLKQPDLKGASTGYGESDDGAGVGLKLARALAVNAKDLVDSGSKNPILFEIIGIFTPEFGPDRMGDLINGILKKNIYRFTRRIAEDLGLDTSYVVRIDREDFLLPTHPLSETKPILFFPESVLSPLPIALSWEDICAAAELNQEVRDNFNEFLQPLFKGTKKPEKEKVKEYLLDKDTRKRVEILMATYMAVEPEKYDFENDPAGEYRWYADALKVLDTLKKPAVKRAETIDDLKEAVEEIVKYFKKAIEDYMWKHSYKENGSPRHESYFQGLFLMLAVPLCEGRDIDVSPETDKGKGPVDFKLSRGNQNVTVEIKLTSNNKLLKGFETQLPIYAKAENSCHGYYVVVDVVEKGEQLNYIKRAVEEDVSGNISLYVINAKPKKSASKADKIE